MKRNILHNATRKAAALLTVAVMVTAGTTTAWAESAYQEAEQSVLDSYVASMTERWGTQMAEMENNSQAANVILDLKLEDTTKYLLNLLTAMDFSWLDNIVLSVNTAVNESSEGIDMNLQLNGSQILQLLEQVDFSNAEIYMKVPELFAGSIKVPMEITGDVTTADGTTQAVSPQEAQSLLSDMLEMDVTSFLPDAATMEELINRYKDIILAGMEDGTEASEQELVIEGVSESCTLYEGRIYEANFYNTAEEVLNTAREDEQLKAVVEKFGEVGQIPDIYAQFQSAIDSGLASLAEDAAEDAGAEVYFFSRLWLDAEGNVAGRQFGMSDDTTTIELFSWYSVQQEDKTALSVEFSDGEQEFLLSGSGAVAADGSLDGNYRLTFDGEPMLNIAVADYVESDTDFVGSYTLSLDSAMSDQETYTALGAYQLALNIKSSTADKDMIMELSLLQNEVSLGSLTLTAVYGENAEVPELGELEPVYDLNVEEDGAAFAEGLDWSPLLQKLMDAGMPEELVQYVDAMIVSALYGEETTAEDGAEDVAAGIEAAEEDTIQQ